MNTVLPGEAYGLRVVETVVEENKFLFYEDICNPRRPLEHCDWIVKRLGAYGCLERSDRYVIDVVDRSGDVVFDFGLTKMGFEYLRQIFLIEVEKVW